jgi:hypothetical protein
VIDKGSLYTSRQVPESCEPWLLSAIVDLAVTL